MYQDNTGQLPLGVDQCRYDGSRLLFRGPRRTLEGDFVACLGGTETFGKFVSKPYPDLLEGVTGVPCVNFGWPNAGVDVFAKDRALLDCAGRARLCVFQVPGALNMSNMYYRVHPRRNDRFLEATGALRALFPEVDFAEISFTRHMMGRLQQVSKGRLAQVRQELTQVWTAGMKTLLRRIDAPVVLLWLSDRSPDAAAGAPDIWSDPALVDRHMLEALRGDVACIVEVTLDPSERGAETGRLRSPRDRRVAQAVLGPGAHRRAAAALQPVLADILGPST